MLLLPFETAEAAENVNNIEAVSNSSNQSFGESLIPVIEKMTEIYEDVSEEEGFNEIIYTELNYFRKY
ncbi:MAG: hypothetical protein JG764_1024 [Clostridiales bacterium]|jgi:hypothetical protein|nr:hypothetical protein [Clostridiales bacterium]